MVTGKLSEDTKLTLGFTHVVVLGDDGHSTNPWIPRNTLNFRADTRVAALPALRLGMDGRWQSVTNNAGYGHQGGYTTVNAFASYEITPQATVRLNIDNVLNKKHLTGLESGGFYAAPINGMVSLDYKL